MQFGNEFERILVSLLAVATGVLLIYLAIQGPLFLGHIRYKTAAVINNQIVGQDVVNLFLLSLISIAGGIALWLRKPIAKYLLITTPLYLIYLRPELHHRLGMEFPRLHRQQREIFFPFPVHPGRGPAGHALFALGLSQGPRRPLQQKRTRRLFRRCWSFSCWSSPPCG